MSESKTEEFYADFEYVDIIVKNSLKQSQR
jgi:hypothetical protein